MAQRAVGDVLGPAREHLRLQRREARPLALGQRLQGVEDATLRLLDLALAGAPRHSLLEADHLVDDVELLRVVNEPALPIDLGVDALPEAHVGLEAQRARQGLLPTRRDGEQQDGADRQGVG